MKRGLWCAVIALWGSNVAMMAVSCGGRVPPPPPPAPTPLPATPPPASPPSGACQAGPGTGSGEGCPKDAHPIYHDAVRAAVEKVLYEHPEWVNREGVITQPHAYMEAVAAQLRRFGFCAINDRDEEVALKITNDFSEQWDIISSGMRPLTLYAATCRPAYRGITSR